MAKIQYQYNPRPQDHEEIIDFLKQFVADKTGLAIILTVKLESGEYKWKNFIQNSLAPANTKELIDKEFIEAAIETIIEALSSKLREVK
jgi:hypothetical protein